MRTLLAVTLITAGMMLPAGQFAAPPVNDLLLLLILAALAILFLILVKLNRQTEMPAAPVISDPSIDEKPSDEEWQVADQQDAAGKKILLLSNDQSDRLGIKRYLDSWSTETMLCSNTPRAFAALIAAQQSNRPFHVVIVDQGRFDMNPRQFALSLRSDWALQQLQLIHVGQLFPDILPEQLKRAGYTKLLTRPVDKTLLYNAIHDIGRTNRDTPEVVNLIDHYTGRKPLQPLSILLAEQNPIDYRRIQTTLKQAGHRIFSVESGARVLDALDSHQFDIAIVSSYLPEVSGFEAFKLYRFTRTEQPLTPFVLLLDSASPMTSQECREAGIGASLQKPIKPGMLLDTIDRLLREKSKSGVTPILPHPKTVVIDGLALDVHRLEDLEELGNGQEFLKELIDNFKQDNERLLEDMERAAINFEWSDFKDIGHAIKDSAGSLGTLALYQLGIQATRISQEDFSQSGFQLARKIKTCNQSSHKALRRYLSERDNLMSR
ncbi:MAG: response regulator [Gammaproteobacteria bacterium]|nr:response regulator [Gammaproteobacteria bacterium]